MPPASANNGPLDNFEQRGDAYYLRLIGTALSFAAFGLGALLLSLFVMPALRLLPRQRMHRVAREVLRAGMRFFIAFARGLRLMTYEFTGRERLNAPGQLIVANHPTLIDAVFLIAFAPRTTCIAKGAMFRNPLTRQVVTACGFISNDSAAEMIEGACAQLDQGERVIMFPEGTRTTPGQTLVFHRGAANVAVRAARRVTPVYIACSPTTLTKGEPWYRIPPRRPHFSLKVGEDLPLDTYRTMASVPIASRAFNASMCQRFQGEMQRTSDYTRAAEKTLHGVIAAGSD